MLKILILISTLLLIPSAYIKSQNEINIDHENLQNFVKSLSCEDLKMYEHFKTEKGFSEILQFFNSPDYKLFKLCQNNEMEPGCICQKTLELLNQGANPNFSFNSLSLIRLASINGQEEMVNILLDKGAIPTQDDITAISLKLNILATCREEEMLSEFDPYPGISFEYDKQKLLTIAQKLKDRLAIRS